MIKKENDYIQTMTVTCKFIRRDVRNPIDIDVIELSVTDMCDDRKLTVSRYVDKNCYISKRRIFEDMCYELKRAFFKDEAKG